MSNDDLVPDSLPDALLQSVAQSDSAGLLADMSEEVLDHVTKSVMNNEALLKVPIVGIAVGMVKGALAVRDRLYVRKLLGFLSETSKATDRERYEYAKKVAKEPKENKRAGTVILEVLDRVTSAEKAKMIGKVFRAYLTDDSISASDLQYIVEMIDKAYLKDLQALESGGLPNEHNLVNVGIRNNVDAEEIMKRMEQYTNQNAELVSRGISSTSIPMINPGYTSVGLTLINILRRY